MGIKRLLKLPSLACIPFRGDRIYQLTGTTLMHSRSLVLAVVLQFTLIQTGMSNIAFLMRMYWVTFAMIHFWTFGIQVF